MNLNNSKYTNVQKYPMKFESVIETQWYCTVYVQ